MSRPQILSTTPISGIKVRWTVFLAAMLTVYYRLPIPFFLLILLLSYLLCGYFWTRMSCRSAVGKCTELEEKVFQGETFKLEFELSSQSYFPIVRCGLSFLIPQQFKIVADVPVETSLSSDYEVITSPAEEVYPSWNSSTIFYAWLPEKEKIQITLALEAKLRGIYYFPYAQFFVGDPSGLYRGMNLIDQKRYMYVFPRLKNINDIQKIIAFEENYRDDSFGLEDRYQVQGVRDYQASDSPKSINWYATARGGSLKSNLYQRTSSQYCLVVLDLSVGSQPSYGLDFVRLEDSFLEEAVSVAAGIALYHLEQGVQTAFYTNAPLLQWQEREEPSTTDRPRHYMQRIKRITTLDFAQGENQGQKILELCAAIDETTRATINGQEELWAKVQEVSAHTSIYIIGYHNPPAGWEKVHDYNGNNARSQAESFYTAQRLGSLASSKVRLLNLSWGGGEK